MNNTSATKVSKSEHQIDEKHDNVEGEHCEVEPDHFGVDKKTEIFENLFKINSLGEFLNSKKFVPYCTKVSAHCLVKYKHIQKKYCEPGDVVADAYQHLVTWLPKFRGEALPTTITNRVIRNLYADALRQEMSKKRRRLDVNFEEGNLESLAAEGSFVEDFEMNETDGNFSTTFINTLSERDKEIAKACLECYFGRGKVVKAEIVRIVSDRIQENFSFYDFKVWKESMKRKLENWRRRNEK